MRVPLLVLLLGSLAWGQHVAIINVRAHPVSSPAIEKATILIREGLITAVGEKVDVPSGVPVIDASGLDAWPGFIDGWSLLGLSEVRSVRSTVDTGELGDWQAHLRAASAINPHSEHIAVARVNGVTTAGIVAASGVIGPEAAVLDLFGRTVTQMIIKPQHPLRVLSLPVPGARKWTKDEGKDYWKTYEKKWKKLDDFLGQARNLARHLEQGVVDFGDGLSGQDRLSLRSTARHLEGDHPWLIRVDKRDHILAALRFARKHDIPLVMCGLREAWQVIDQLKDTRHKLLLGSIFSSPGRDEPYDASFANAAVLHRAGLNFGFMSGSSSRVRNLPYSAAMAVSHGLPMEAAMRALTLGAAETLGIARTHGTLYPGKIADIVLYRGNPLDARVSPTHVFIRGCQIQLKSRHTRLAEPYLSR